jgi:hypothetical protein
MVEVPTVEIPSDEGGSIDGEHSSLGDGGAAAKK